MKRNRKALRMSLSRFRTGEVWSTSPENAQVIPFRADKAGRRTSRSGDRIDGPAGAQDPAFLDIHAVEKAFGSATVLGGVDLKVARGEFV